MLIEGYVRGVFDLLVSWLCFFSMPTMYLAVFSIDCMRDALGLYSEEYARINVFKMANILILLQLSRGAFGSKLIGTLWYM